jgi:subfamily B ATP-binding cassette protein MsbA
LTNPILFPRRLAAQILRPFVDQQPATLLIRETARREWRLIVLSFFCSLLQASTEGLTLGMMFLAVEVLSKPTGSTADIGNKLISASSYFNTFPNLVEKLNQISVFQGFTILLSLALLLKLIQGLAIFVGSISTGYFTTRVSSRLTSQLHSHILDYTFSCASRYRVGDLQYINSAGPGAIISQINSYSGLITTILLLITYLCVLIRLSPWLLIAAILLGGASAIVQQILLPRVGKRAQIATKMGTDLVSKMTENIQGLRLLHTSGFLREAASDVDQQTKKLEQNSRGQVRLNAINAPITIVLPIFMIAVIAWLSILFFGQRSSGILPSLVTFVVALQRLNGSIGSVSETFLRLKANGANLKVLNDFLLTHDKEFRRKSGKPYEGFNREIRLEDVSLQYAKDLSPALHSINITIPKGNTVALVGSSGAGKSSIADLLAGLYDPTAGEILIDGTELQRFDLASWQKRIGVVSQDTFLFNATIAANISFGTPGARLEDVKLAAQQAQATGFIENLPDGFNTLVGERGYRLSGGQRQRISLARAILRQPDLLILDEATSALDTESERLVQEAIDQFDNKHTILVIAHRLSTIVNADQIYVLDQGRVIEQGNHSHLLHLDGRYSRLWQQQVKSRKANSLPLSN